MTRDRSLEVGGRGPGRAAQAGRLAACVSVLTLVCGALGALRAETVPSTPVAPAAGPADVRERASVELVMVPVSVRDADGQPISGLTREDFTIYEDGAPQPIAAFDREPTPVAIVFAIDTSGSMDRYMPFVKAGAIRFVQRIPRVFAVSLARFSDDSEALCDFTSDRNHLYYQINTLKANGSGTAILDATRDAIARASRKPGRRAVVLFTDGEENTVPPEERAKAEDETVRSARLAGVTVYYVGYGWVVKPQMLERIARATGGVYLAAGAERKITQAFDAVARELDSQYTLSYVPRPGRPGEWRPIRVEVRRPSVTVAARAGYLVPSVASVSR